MQLSPMTRFLIKAIVVTLFVSIPAVLIVNNPSFAEAIWKDNPFLFLLFLVPSLLVVVRWITKRGK